MTRRVFWEQPYLSQLDTTVAMVEGEEIQLADSIFFAESGGQESDFGSIGGHPVLCAELRGSALVYTLASDHGLGSGQTVRVEIDWPRRYALMRMHFAAEIVLEVAASRFGLTEKIGAHIAPSHARIDFQSHSPVTPLLESIRSASQDIIERDLAISTGFDDEAKLRRYWQVEALARVPCGGTHLRRTGEVGLLALKRRNIGRGKERIEISAAPRSAP